MVVPIKDRKYEVDFNDVYIMKAVDDGRKAVIEAAAKLQGGVMQTENFISVLDIVRNSIDGVVGDGVSAEAFGDSYNWIDIFDSWTKIEEASAKNTKEIERDVSAMVRRISALSEEQNDALISAPSVCSPVYQNVRKPVRVE